MLQLILLSALLYDCLSAGSAHGQEKKFERFLLSNSTLSESRAPLYMAKEHGLFEKYGLDAEIVNIRGAAINVASLMAGEIQMAVAAGTVGNGCGRPLHVDEVHINRHTFAVVTRVANSDSQGPPIRPLLFTTLTSIGPRVLLNVENGDYGVLQERDCGCALGNVGLTQHLHRIRSYEKFTSEGMNFFYGDLYELFEKTLPAEFGGGPGNY